jgi:hypothetical protein
MPSHAYQFPMTSHVMIMVWKIELEATKPAHKISTKDCRAEPSSHPKRTTQS